MVKFSDILDEARHAFPWVKISSYVLSNAIAKEFPLLVSKKLGESRHKYYYGIEDSLALSESGASSRSTNKALALEQSLQHERRMNECLQQQLQQLQQRVEELEHHQHSSLSIQTLDDQMQILLRPDIKITFHGPDTVDHFQNFSLDAVIAELRANAPDVVDMFQQLGNYDWFEDDEFARITQLRSTTALCTLLKGRSIKMLGVQLLISFMLIGRATSKQVRTST